MLGNEQRPLFKLSAGLLETYKRINLVYYEKKKYNDGFDDKHGDYLLRDGDVLGERFVVQGERLGSGSFGQVAQCRDLLSGALVAVKILRNRKPFFNQGMIEGAHPLSVSLCVVSRFSFQCGRCSI
jgi:hypothetical protein